MLSDADIRDLLRECDLDEIRVVEGYDRPEWIIRVQRGEHVTRSRLSKLTLAEAYDPKDVIRTTVRSMGKRINARTMN